MRKLKRILTGLLAVVLVISNLSVATITVNAAEVDNTIVTTEGEGENDPTTAPTETEAPTEAPAETEAPTEAPAETEAPTEAPAETEAPTEAPAETEAPTEAPELIQPEMLTFKDLGNYVGGYGCEVNVDKDGVATFAFNNEGGFGERVYNLPANMDTSKVVKVELVLEEGSGVIAKLYPLENAGGYVTNQYGGADDYDTNYDAPFVIPTHQFKSIGIASPTAVNDVVISGIKFTYGDVELPEREAPEEEPEEDGIAYDSKWFAYKTFTAEAYANKWGTQTEAVFRNNSFVPGEDKNSNLTNIAIMSLYPEDLFEDDGKTLKPEAPTSITTSLFGVTIVADGEESTYFFKDLVYDANENQLNKNRDGSVTITFVGNYKSVFFALPSELHDKVIEKITFNFGGGSQITYGDNIIVNPYFEAEGDLSVWKLGNGKSEITAEESVEKIFTTDAGKDIYTYGKIARDPETSSTQDCFSQELTEAVPGKSYKYEFYAMLSDDYKGQLSNLCNVTFAPYGWRSDRENDYGGNEYWGSYSRGVLSGDVDKELTPGVWTKFSGTFTIPVGEEKVFIRIIEQGDKNAYGAGPCALGDYYVTGVSLTEIIQPSTTIEEDLVGWKTAITGAFGDDAIAGTCLGQGTITYDYLQALAKKHFNAITFENEMKPDITLGSTPKFDEDGELVYNFSVADRMLGMIKAWNDADPADDINFKIRGHVLVWHSQTPEWFFHKDYDVNKGWATKEEMNAHLEHYIAGVFNHYENAGFTDMFYGWDVVNEAMSDSTGKPRKTSDNSNWARIYGEESDEYIINAFRYANKYAPRDAEGNPKFELYYNDYNDSDEPKASGIAALVAKITSFESDAELPTRIDGVGMQAHHNFANPAASQIMEAANKYLEALKAEGNDGTPGNVQMTELDVKASTTVDFDKKQEHAKQAWRFKEIFDAYRMLEQETPGCVGGITMWGITDETSWLQSSNSVGGAGNGEAVAPLLFFVEDYVAKAKPAYWAFMDAEKLDPATQDVTVNQQLVADSFADGNTYVISDEDVSGSFVPVWNESGLSIKVNVEDASDDGANDTITVYIDENMKRKDGDFAVVTVARNAAGVTPTETGYETVINIDMETALCKKFNFDIAISNNGAIGVFNDKKETQATTSKFYAEGILKPYATIKKGTATIDGKLDALWLGAEEIPMTIKAGGGNAKATGTAKFMWDEEYLYAFYDIKDEVLDDKSAEDHAKDSIEVFIDENNNKTNGYEADTHQYRVNFKNEQTFGANSSAENLQSATRVVEGGYVLETAFKWTHITPEAGDKIGLEFQINDAENGGRIGTMSWYDTSGYGYQTAKVFGTVTLVADEVVAPEKDPALGEVDTDDLPIGSTAEDIPEALWISGVKDGKIADRTFTYTGSAIEPKFNVFDGKKKLKEGTDYKVTYANNVKAAASTAKKAPTATITGIGNYESKVVVKFDIKKVNVNSLEIDDTIVVNKTSKVQKPVPAVLFNGKALKNKTDFTVSYPTTGKGAYKNGGTYDIVIKGKGNFEGEFTVTFVIEGNPYDIKKDKDSKIDVVYDLDENKAVKYQKGGVKPAVTVLYDGVALEAGKDYKVSYANNTKVAKAKDKKAPTITVKGIGHFKGTITQKFTIDKQKLEVATITAKDVSFNPKGGVNKTTVKIVDVNGKTLKAKTDYSKTYEYTYKEETTLLNKKDGEFVVKAAGKKVANGDIVPAGTVICVTVTGAGNYKGAANTVSGDEILAYNESKIVGEYTVVPASIASAIVTIKPQGYTGSAVTFDETQITSVKIGKTTLKAEDYAIVADSFANNKEKTSKATVVLEGTGNYTGTVTAKFTIKAKGFALKDFFASLF